jgi:hypothetical protein
MDNNNISTGFLYGDAGMAVAYHLLAAGGDESTGEDGTRMLDRISENIAAVGELDFANGLAGIGWSIEWLVQNGLLKDVNTDEILAEIDDILYKNVTTSKQYMPGLFNGAMGKAAYFIKRARSKNPGTHRYTQLSHQECLVMLTDDIDEVFREPNGALLINAEWIKEHGEKGLPYLRDIAEYILLFSQLVRINEPVVENAFLEIMVLIEDLLDDLLAAGGDEIMSLPAADEAFYYHLFYLAVCYAYKARIHRHPHWLENAARYTRLLHNIAPGQAAGTNTGLFQALTVYSLLNICQPSPLYSAKLAEIIRELKRVRQPLRFHRGKGILAVAELSLARPDLIDSWHELFYL